MKRTAIAPKLMIGFLALVSGTGCLLGDPGGQTRKALTQSKIYEVRADGSVWIEAVGTQTERFEVAGGDIVFLPEPDDSGRRVIDFSKSHIKYYVWADPSAKDASATAMSAWAASQAMFAKAMATAMEEGQIQDDGVQVLGVDGLRQRPQGVVGLPCRCRSVSLLSNRGQEVLDGRLVLGFSEEAD